MPTCWKANYGKYSGGKYSISTILYAEDSSKASLYNQQLSHTYKVIWKFSRRSVTILESIKEIVHHTEDKFEYRIINFSNAALSVNRTKLTINIALLVKYLTVSIWTSPLIWGLILGNPFVYEYHTIPEGRF